MVLYLQQPSLVTSLVVLLVLQHWLELQISKKHHCDVSIKVNLTYEDVENIDSMSVIITARSGVELGASGVGGTFSAAGYGSLEGGLNVSGVVTATSFSGDGQV